MFLFLARQIDRTEDDIKLIINVRDNANKTVNNKIITVKTKIRLKLLFSSKYMNKDVNNRGDMIIAK